MAVQFDYKHKLLEDIVECFFCENYQGGCRAFFNQDKDLEDHMKGCVFRLVYCPCCQKSKDYSKIQFKDWTDHLTALHDVAVHNLVPNKSKPIPLSPKLLLCKSWFLKIKLNDKVDFFLNGKVENDRLHLWISIYGSPIEAENYHYTISNLDKNGSGSLISTNVKTMDCNPNDIINDLFVFTIGLEFAKTMESEDQGLKITIHDLKNRPKWMTLKQNLRRLYCRFVPTDLAREIFRPKINFDYLNYHYSKSSTSK